MADWAPKARQVLHKVYNQLGVNKHIFYNPVDPNLIRDYYTIIKQPMNLQARPRSDPLRSGPLPRMGGPVALPRPGEGGHRCAAAGAACQPASRPAGSAQPQPRTTR
jgi:hypothetical protein